MISIPKLPPFKRFCITIGAIPTTYIESLSYYETLLWLCKYLQDTVIPAVNTNAEAVTELQTAFETLQSYVDSYFDNLDVQEEINNKLDEMVEQGTLQDIITAYLQIAGVLGYDTVADMKAATNLIDGSIAKTLGYNSLNDGGSATYKIRTITNDDVVDEMFIIALADDSLVAELIIKDNTVSLLEVGCDPTGTIDESTKIKNIIYKLKEGGKIIIPTGTFKVSNIDIDFSVDNLVIEGQGFHSILNNTSEDYWTIEFSELSSRITLNNFAIQCNTNANGIKFTSLSDNNKYGYITTNNILIRNARKGMYLRDIVYLQMNKSFITITNENTSSATNYAVDYSGYEYNNFIDCVFQANSSASFPLVILRQSNYLIFDRCEFAYGGTGIKLDTDSTAASSSNIQLINGKYYNLTTGIDLQLSTNSLLNIDIGNNVFYSKGNANTESFVNVATSNTSKKVNGIKIYNNSFARINSTSMNYAIIFGNDSVVNSIIENNLFTIGDRNYINVGNNIVTRFSDMSSTVTLRSQQITGNGSTKKFTLYNVDGILPMLNTTPTFIVNIPELDLVYTVKSYYNSVNPNQLRGDIIFQDAPPAGTYTVYYKVVC